MDYFYGNEQEIKIKARKSFNVPEKFKKIIGKDIVLIKSLDNALLIFPQSRYKFEECFIGEPRFLLLGDDGKITLTDDEFEHLRITKNCAIYDGGNYLNVFSQEQYEKKDAEQLTDKDLQVLDDSYKVGEKRAL